MAELSRAASGAASKTKGSTGKSAPARSDEPISEVTNKFELSEIVVGTIYTFTTDGLCALLDIFTLESFAVASWVIRNGVAGTIWMWFYAKKDPHVKKAGRLIFKGFANATPLFINTIMFLIEVYIHNHPEKFAALEKVAGATGGKA